MLHFSSKLRLLGKAARLQFSDTEAEGTQGTLTFYGEGVPVDALLRRAWGRYGQLDAYPFPAFGTTLKTVAVSLAPTAQGQILALHVALTGYTLEVYWAQRQQQAPALLLVLRTTRFPKLAAVIHDLSDQADGFGVELAFAMASQAFVLPDAMGGQQYVRGISLHTTLLDTTIEADASTPADVPLRFAIAHTPPSTQAAPAAEEAFAERPPVPGFETVQWMEVQAQWGAIRLDRLGIQLAEGNVWLALAGALQTKALAVQLQGLKVGLSIADRTAPPAFALSGLGIAYHTPLFQSQGLLMRTSHQDDYAGTIAIRSPLLTLQGIGAYGNVDGNPALLLYGYMQQRLTQWPSVSIDGLALGFGYNRRAVVPAVTELAQFPLVAQVLTQRSPDHALQAMAKQMTVAFPPQDAQLFLAAGMRFSTYKVLEGFLLLVAQWGSRPTYHLIGIGKIAVPPVDHVPQASIEVVLQASIDPSASAVHFVGQLTDNAYLFAPTAKLSGGFALSVWLGDSDTATVGDFVMTVGGYHPDFNQPAHYPTPQPVAITWSVSTAFFLKGSAYLAVTPAAVMLGTRAQAHWKQGQFSASFDLNMDLLAQWKPFYYRFTTQVMAQVAFEASVLQVRRRIDLEVGAQLDIWGPSFSGKAAIDVKVFGMRFDFGLSFGEAERTAPKIDWAQFQQEFLPAPSDTLMIRALSPSLSANGDTSAPSIFAPHDLRLELSSALPISAVAGDMGTYFTPFGVYPMRLDAVSVTLEIVPNDPNLALEIADYRYQNLPAALWHRGGAITLDTPSLVPQLLTGAIIQVIAPQSQFAYTVDTQHWRTSSHEQPDATRSSSHSPKGQSEPLAAMQHLATASVHDLAYAEWLRDLPLTDEL